jgi:hypothetical protein
VHVPRSWREKIRLNVICIFMQTSIFMAEYLVKGSGDNLVVSLNQRVLNDLERTWFFSGRIIQLYLSPFPLSRQQGVTCRAFSVTGKLGGGGGRGVKS